MFHKIPWIRVQDGGAIAAKAFANPAEFVDQPDAANPPGSDDRPNLAEEFIIQTYTECKTRMRIQAIGFSKKGDLL